MNDRAYREIEVEPFDREYDLSELLPMATIEDLCRHAESSAICLAVFHPDGSPYVKVGSWHPDHIDALGHIVAQSAPQSGCTVPESGDSRYDLIPIIYELEAKGYLAVPSQGNQNHAMSALGQVYVDVFTKLMQLKHQTMMTSSLHGTVVQDSYARLEEKAAKLERSEEKYRLLASNLEIEVKKKTAEIKAAHVFLMEQEKLAAIGQLAAGMAHEINTPLGFMISNLNSLDEYIKDIKELVSVYRKIIELASKEGGDSTPPMLKTRCKAALDLERDLDSEFLMDDIASLTAETMDGALRIQKIISDLKRVARPGEKERELIDIPESIEAVLTVINNRIGDGITVRKDFTSVPLASGVAQQLNQVWLNLLLNAVDALGGQGDITIRIWPEDNHINVAVSDNGCGIPENNLTKIFDPFFTTKDVGSGTGMGLHLAYQVVSSHGGIITAVSELEQGSTFTVRLPFSGNE